MIHLHRKCAIVSVVGFCVAGIAQDAAAQACETPQVYRKTITITMVDNRPKASEPDPMSVTVCEGDAVVWTLDNRTNRRVIVELNYFERKGNPGFRYPLLGVGKYSEWKRIDPGKKSLIVGNLPDPGVYSDIAPELSNPYKYTIFANGNRTDPELIVTRPPTPPPAKGPRGAKRVDRQRPPDKKLDESR
jgi:hypothetical protein